MPFTTKGLPLEGGSEGRMEARVPAGGAMAGCATQLYILRIVGDKGHCRGHHPPAGR